MRQVALLYLLAAAAICISACGSTRTARTAAKHVTASAPTSPRAVVYRGATSQRAHIAFVVDRGRDAITALRLAVVYRCARHRSLRLRALVLRPDGAWALIARWPTAIVGFSDWFSGPDGHDFHITGTLPPGARSMTGTIHSLLVHAGQLGRCDSGHVHFQAALTTARLRLPTPVAITMRQYKALPSGITIASAQRRLGAANDREIFTPGGTIALTLPSGPPGAQSSWLDYRWKGHPARYFQFFFRAGHLLAHEAGRSIATT